MSTGIFNDRARQCRALKNSWQKTYVKLQYTFHVQEGWERKKQAKNTDDGSDQAPNQSCRTTCEEAGTSVKANATLDNATFGRVDGFCHMMASLKQYVHESIGARSPLLMSVNTSAAL